MRLRFTEHRWPMRPPGDAADTTEKK